MKTRSLFRQLAVGLTATIGCIAIIVVSLLGWYNSRQSTRALQAEADDYISSLKGSLEIPLWNLDYETIRVIGKTISQNELINSLVIQSVQGEKGLDVVFSVHKGGGDKLIERSDRVRHGKTVIGNITLTLSPEPIFDANRQYLKSIIVTTVIILVALLLVSNFFLRLFFRKPMTYLNTLVDSYALGHYREPAERIPYQEFQPLENVLMEMGRKIDQQIEDLRQAEKKFRSIFENALEGLFQATPKGRFVSVNPTAASLLGYDSPNQLIEEVNNIGRQLYTDQSELKKFWKQILAEGQVNRFETRFNRRDGTTIWVELSARTIHDKQDGALALIEGHMADITAQKEAEQDRVRLQEQLQQSQKMEALGSLAGGIAHDFNNLLQAMSGYVQLMLLKKSPDDPDHKYLVEVDLAASRASDLIRRLLTFSRKMEINFQAVSINDLVRSTIKLLERTIPKMVSITTSLDPELPIIEADANQMEQVLMNLVNNAVDAMEGAGELALSTKRFHVESIFRDRHVELQSGDYIRIKITDTGHGMDEMTCQRAFDPFFTTKEIGKGTGLGLSTVYGIVKGHKGQIACQSYPDAGTTMIIYLPIQHGHPMEFKTEEDDSVPLPGGHETILLVDDEEIIREIAEDLLRQYGYQVLLANSGETALAIFAEKQSEIDLVVLDLGMPGMGGEKCLKGLKEIDPKVRIIVASGYSAHKIARDPEQFGASGFLPKPYKLHLFLNQVRNVLDG